MRKGKRPGRESRRAERHTISCNKVFLVQNIRKVVINFNRNNTLRLYLNAHIGARIETSLLQRLQRHSSDWQLTLAKIVCRLDDDTGQNRRSAGCSFLFHLLMTTLTVSSLMSVLRAAKSRCTKAWFERYVLRVEVNKNISSPCHMQSDARTWVPIAHLNYRLSLDLLPISTHSWEWGAHHATTDTKQLMFSTCWCVLSTKRWKKSVRAGGSSPIDWIIANIITRENCWNASQSVPFNIFSSKNTSFRSFLTRRMNQLRKKIQELHKLYFHYTKRLQQCRETRGARRNALIVSCFSLISSKTVLKWENMCEFVQEKISIFFGWMITLHCGAPRDCQLIVAVFFATVTVAFALLALEWAV